MTLELLTTIDRVKIYSEGATISRVASFSLEPGQTEPEIAIKGLPLALDDRTVKARIEGTENQIIVTNLHLGLSVGNGGEVSQTPLGEELRQGRVQVQQLENELTLIEREITLLKNLAVLDRPGGKEGEAPPLAPLAARLELTHYKIAQINDRQGEKRSLTEQLRQAREHLQDLEEQEKQATTAQAARPEELRKTVLIQLQVIGANFPLENRLIVEYFVPGARWLPSYICRLDSQTQTATLAVRAYICQQTGEDWTGVALELSTAQPQNWCELPELPSLRLGRAQPPESQKGWRSPPVGVEQLFADFDIFTNTQPLGRERSGTKGQMSAKLPQTSEITLESLLDEMKLESLLRDASSETTLESLLDEMTLESLLRDASSEMTAMELEIEDWDNPSQLVVQTPAQEEERFRGRGVQEESFRGRGVQEEQDLAQFTGRGAPPMSAKRRFGGSPPPAPTGEIKRQDLDENYRRQEGVLKEEWTHLKSDALNYSWLRLSSPENMAKRGKLYLLQQQEVYLEIIKKQEISISFDVLEVIKESEQKALDCLQVPPPPGSPNWQKKRASFDYAYVGQGAIDVSSDGQFHSVPLLSQETAVDLRYIVVPREAPHVFRIAQLRNPLDAPLLPGLADIYVNGEYLLGTAIATVPPQGMMELGLGVEPGIKIARNVSYQEVRSGFALVGLNEFRHQIEIEIGNQLNQNIAIEVRERVPVPQENAKVEVELGAVNPSWEKYEQEERQAPIKGGYRWRVNVPAKEKMTLSAQYIVKTFVDKELVGGNRREG